MNVLTNIAEETTMPQPKLALVTPDMARDWLSHSNTENRRIRGHWVDALSREMTEGRWMMTGDPIRFDERGTLIDGQHRLAALVKADVTVPLYIIDGLPIAVRDVIDTNATRTAGDTLQFAGFKNANNVSGTARIALSRRDGYFRTAKDKRQLKYTNSAILEFVTQNSDLVDVVRASSTKAKDISAWSTAAWCYAMWRLQQIDMNARVEFEQSIYEARTDGPGDPHHALIRFFTNDNPRKGDRKPIPETLYAAFRSWNAWREHEPLQRINVANGASGPMGNAIPEPV